jgi:hypothetical protein
MMNLGCCSHTVEMRSCRALAPFRVIVRSQNDEEPPLLAWLPAVCKCGDDSEKQVLLQGVVGTRKTLCTITIHTTKRLHMLRFLSVMIVFWLWLLVIYVSVCLWKRKGVSSITD